MPPKIRITKAQILDAAVELVRQFGAEALNARELAKQLDCSTQPIFSNFENMEQLRNAVVDAAYRMHWQQVEQEIQLGKYPAYKASGMAYIHFAQQERELFKLLYMRNRTGETDVEDPETRHLIQGQLQEAMGMGEETAQRFHLEMWAVVHGFAVMAATGFLPLDEQLISASITDIYMGLKTRFGI